MATKKMFVCDKCKRDMIEGEIFHLLRIGSLEFDVCIDCMKCVAHKTDRWIEGFFKTERLKIHEGDVALVIKREPPRRRRRLMKTFKKKE